MANDVENAIEGGLLSDIRRIIEEARHAVFDGISIAQIEHNWKIGRRIVEEEQDGAKTIAELSDRLCAEYGEGYSERNLREFRAFYLVFGEDKIWHTRVPNLKWSHLRLLMRVDDPIVREWYINEASNENWSVRTLAVKMQKLLTCFSSENEEAF